MDGSDEWVLTFDLTDLHVRKDNPIHIILSVVLYMYIHIESFR